MWMLSSARCAATWKPTRLAATRQRRPPRKTPGTAAGDRLRAIGPSLEWLSCQPPCQIHACCGRQRPRLNAFVDQPGEEAGIDDELAPFRVEGRGRFGRDDLVP